MNAAVESTETPDVAPPAWHLDPARSRVGFQVRIFWGLARVRGTFERYTGTFDLSRGSAIDLTIDAASLTTRLARRDVHLRSAAFFDAERHPLVRFVSESAALTGTRLRVRGRLRAAGRSVPLVVAARLHRDGEDYEIRAAATVDQRALGMTYSPAGMIRPSAKLLVRGRLVRDR